jgi:hypothetical protein
MTYDDLSNSGFLKAARAAEFRQRRLIAAAPDMLAALKLAIAELNTTYYTPTEPRGIVAQTIRAAIAKAEGSQ